MSVTFVLLGLAVCAVWIPPLGLQNGVRLRPWVILFALSAACGVAQGVLQPAALVALAVLLALAWRVPRLPGPVARCIGLIALAALSLALAVHAVPGFNNPVLIDRLRLSADALPYTQYLNFDKGAVGLVLLGCIASRVTRDDRVSQVLATSVVALVVTAAAVFAIAVSLGIVRFEPKLPNETLPFLAVNLLFTCVAEEAFFRTVVQDGLAGRWPSMPRGPARSLAREAFAAVLAAALFGAAHLGGGVSMAILAGTAGLGYATVYAATQRIEASILVHFGLNATHFLLFTYPAMKSH